MQQFRIVYLQDYDEAAGIAVPVLSGFRFYATKRFYRKLDRERFASLREILDAAYALHCRPSPAA